MNIFLEKKVTSIHCNFLITFLAYYSTYSVNFLLKNIHVSHSMHVIAGDVSLPFAGIILRSLFIAFCSCFMFCYYLSCKNSLMVYEFLSLKKCFLASPATSCSSLFSIDCHTICMLWHLMCCKFLSWEKNIFGILHIFQHLMCHCCFWMF